MRRCARRGPSIDVLFETAAEAYGDALLGVLLTGASADGAEGLAAVKARGGRAIVEDPATAECRHHARGGARGDGGRLRAAAGDRSETHSGDAGGGHARMTPQVDILLVDDHEENLLALEAILADPAYNLVRAHVGPRRAQGGAAAATSR